MAKITMDSGTQRRKNKVSKSPNYLTGSNKVPIVDKCSVGKSPATIGRPDMQVSVKLLDYIVYTRIISLFFIVLQRLFLERGGIIKTRFID